jgi:hypothetical protein
MRRIFDRLRAIELHPARGPGCLDELAIAAAVDGAASAETIEHLSRCAACRTQVAHLSRLLGVDSVADEVDRLERRRPAGWPSGRALIGLAAAAAVVLLAVIPVLPRSGDDADGFRDEAPVAASAVPLLREPDLTGTGPGLRWSSVTSATQYRVTVFDAEGALVWSTETSDTSATIPADVRLAPATQYWWRVEARVDFDRWNPSVLGVFEVGGRR